MKDAYSNLVRIERNVDKTTVEYLDIMATWIVNDIRSNWSSQSPSSKGQAPAIWSGNLDSSIIIDEQGRGVGGRFTSTENAKFRFIRVDTRLGDNPLGRGDYSGILEFDLDRPFLQPAMDRANSVQGDIAKRTIKVL